MVANALERSFHRLQELITTYSISHGTCALVVYIRKGVAFTATAGDSQAVLTSYEGGQLPYREIPHRTQGSRSTPNKKAATSTSSSSTRLSSLIARFEEKSTGNQLPVKHTMAKYQVISRVLRPNSPEEMNRIEQAGGFVLRGCVDGVVAVSRALGDTIHQPKVSCQPLISIHVPNKSCSKCRTKAPGSKPTCACAGVQDQLFLIIMASDGLWDVLRPGEAVDIALKEVHRRFSGSNGQPCKGEISGSKKTPRCHNMWEVSKKLCEVAVQRQSRDNISVVCVVFRL